MKTGSSPLTRGKPNRRSQSIRNLVAHPRSRGENTDEQSARAGDAGSSPLTRGKHGAKTSPQPGPGLIPAHAGKTLPDLRFYRADRSDLGKP